MGEAAGRSGVQNQPWSQSSKLHGTDPRQAKAKAGTDTEC